MGVGKPAELSMAWGSRKTLIVVTLRADDTGVSCETGELCGGTRRGMICINDGLDDQFK